jgi:hypothetical protein
VRQLHLHFAVAPLALAGFGFRPLALGQIEDDQSLALHPPDLMHRSG